MEQMKGILSDSFLKKLENEGFKYVDSIEACESAYFERIIKENKIAEKDIRRIGSNGAWHYLMKCKARKLKKLLYY